jgi:hypothetical protein
MQVSRRGFLKSLTALSAVALAAKLSLPSEAMAEEVREELIKDIAKPQRTIFDMRDVTQIEPLWASVSATSTYWAEEIVKDMTRKLDAEVMRELTVAAYRSVAPIKQLSNMTRELARRLDDDLRAAKVPAEKQLIVGMPRWEIVDRYGTKAIEIKAGLVEQDTIWGKEFRVEYVRPTDIIIPGGLDKRGQAEFGGLILPS